MRADGYRHRIVDIVLTELNPTADAEALVGFLSTNRFPFHAVGAPTVEEARRQVASGRYWSDDSVGFWIDAGGERVGIVVVEDLDDVDDGGTPLFDLRLAEAHRGRGLGAPVLRAFTDMVFARWSSVTRIEGTTRDDNLAMRATFRSAGWVKEAFHRDAWPVTGEAPRAAVGYAVLRRDWVAGVTTPVEWDDG